MALSQAVHITTSSNVGRPTAAANKVYLVELVTSIISNSALRRPNVATTTGSTA